MVAVIKFALLRIRGFTTRFFVLKICIKMLLWVLLWVSYAVTRVSDNPIDVATNSKLSREHFVAD